MAPTVAKTTIKPYKLKATTGDKLTRDDLATWKEVLLSHCRQNEAWQKFLPTGDNKEWKAADSGERNVWNQERGLGEAGASHLQEEHSQPPRVRTSQQETLPGGVLQFFTCSLTMIYLENAL